MPHWPAPGPFSKPPSEAPPEDESAFIPPETDPSDQRAILVIPDSRGRIRTWHYLRSLPYWRHFVALCSKSTPQDYLDYLKERHIDCIIAGEDHVDLRMALEELYSRYAVRVVRVDAGGTLNGLLLRQGLVSEVSVLIYPSLVGGETISSIFRAPDLPAAADADIASGKGAEAPSRSNSCRRRSSREMSCGCAMRSGDSLAGNAARNEVSSSQFNQFNQFIIHLQLKSMGPAWSLLDVYRIAPAAVIGVSPCVAKSVAVNPDIMRLVSGYCKGKDAVKTVPAAAVATNVVVVHRDRIASPVVGCDGYLSIAFRLGSLRIGRVGGLWIVTGIVWRII